jgi:hypothetical protein
VVGRNGRVHNRRASTHHELSSGECDSNNATKRERAYHGSLNMPV